MQLTARQNEILARIRREGRVEVETLAAGFNVTTQTIRRDLNLLSERGLAARVHGGARFTNSISNVGYEERRSQASAAKEAIGARTAALIPDSCSVMLNIGTTTEQVARALAGHDDLVVISNNVNVINTLIGSSAKELILAGGVVRPTDGAIVGEEAVDFISRYKVDYAVIGASAIDIDGAVLDYDSREVSVARAILRNARARILVSDALKFDRSAPVRICDIAEIDIFVTDRGPPDPFMEAAARGETEVLIAEPGLEALDDCA
ncbi:DeoR/GlpR transcriptional regulator [Pikeienuella piscinae]|uniref:DeoR/GlpR transcriptional regulator n=1 Tax=Pikeienuella piscinae TaxID=2748098 RepID=A0A7L5BTG0_9RHOB|nr:DeoR/GlpR family DNA-binding transcription regulator [Pikeienuella piscinae]QIE54692.1 DeoR/GlpR transcriptional regulator [Pikeienuella piscinae]